MCRKNLQAVFEWAQMFNSIDSWSRETVLFRELPASRSRSLSLPLSLEGSASVKRGAVELPRPGVISFHGCEIAAHNAVHIKASNC